MQTNISESITVVQRAALTLPHSDTGAWSVPAIQENKENTLNLKYLFKLY